MTTVAETSSRARSAAFGIALLLPLAGLWLLIAAPSLDFHWEHHPTHFWLVLALAGVNVALGWVMSEAASRRRDARLFLVSLSFLASAGFLGLHALATPGVLLDAPNTGFVIATPVGLLVAGLFAAASSLDFPPGRSEAVVRRQRLLRGGVVAALVGWGAWSLAELPPLNEPLPPEDASAPLKLLAAVGLLLFAAAAFRYWRLYEQRPAPLLLAVVAAFLLLAEAFLAVAFGRNWHASWWEWHVLMAIAFGLVAVAARREYRREQSAEESFAALYLEHTIARVDASYGAALAEIVAAERDERSAAAIIDDVVRSHGLSGEQRRLLERAAEEVRRADELFRPFVSPELARRIDADPTLAELGGQERDVSVLFADLQGFTAFSEQAEPADVFAMLNEYWGLAVPVILRNHEGVIERFAGDAVMVVFNAAGDQPDHARRAAQAALDLQEATERLAQGRPGWPRFRAGVSSGPAIVGNVGAAEQRSFAAIGDTTNLAARLQSSAEPGQVVVGAATAARLAEVAELEPLGELDLKGKAEPVEAFVLRRIGSPQTTEEDGWRTSP
jgi:class 3 adenylate cyclase